MERMPKISSIPVMCQPALIRLGKALQQLDPQQGQRARRNARALVTARLRQLKTVLDLHYPAPARQRGERAVIEDPFRRAVQRKRDLRKAGWQPADPAIVAACAAARVEVKLIKVPAAPDGTSPAHTESWVPSWAGVIGNSATKLRRARTDIQYRKALVVETTLLAQTAQGA